MDKEERFIVNLYSQVLQTLNFLETLQIELEIGEIKTFDSNDSIEMFKIK